MRKTVVCRRKMRYNNPVDTQHSGKKRSARRVFMERKTKRMRLAALLLAAVLAFGLTGCES